MVLEAPKINRGINHVEPETKICFLGPFIGTRSPKYGSRNPSYGTWRPIIAPETPHLVPHTLSIAPGTPHMVPGGVFWFTWIGTWHNKWGLYFDEGVDWFTLRISGTKCAYSTVGGELLLIFRLLQHKGGIWLDFGWKWQTYTLKYCNMNSHFGHFYSIVVFLFVFFWQASLFPNFPYQSFHFG